MFKQISIFVLTTFSLTISATIYLPKDVTIKDIQQAKTQNIQIAWDIHNVLAQKDGRAKNGAIIRHIFPIIGSKIIKNAAWDEVNRLSKINDISGEAYATIFLKHKELKLAKMVEETANAYMPRENMEELVRSIHNMGITQRLASNIGPRFLANMNTKFKNKHKCHIFDFIMPGKIVDYSKYSGLNPITKTEDHLTSECKPHPQFYDDFNTTYKKNSQSIIIFVDDKIENVQAAVKAGWIGIHFDATKKSKHAVAQLQNDLASLGIFNLKK